MFLSNNSDDEEDFEDAADGGRAVVTGSIPAAPRPHPVNVPAAAQQRVSTADNGDSTGNVASCSLCLSSLEGFDVVGCGDCSRNFHAEKRCLGVDDSVIKVLLGDNGGAVKYVCCTCRLGTKTDSREEGCTVQILGIISSLAADIKVLTESVMKLQQSEPKPLIIPESGSNPEISPNGSLGNNNGVMHREDVLLEVREICEREKRKESIILRGVGDVSVSQA